MRRSGEIPVLALLHPSTIRVPQVPRTWGPGCSLTSTSHGDPNSGCPTLSRTLRKGGVSSKARPLSYTPSTTLVILNAVKDPCIGSPSYHPNFCHLDRSAAKWRDPRIGSPSTQHNPGALPFAHFAKGGVSSNARPLSSILLPENESPDGRLLTILTLREILLMLRRAHRFRSERQRLPTILEHDCAYAEPRKP